KRDVFRRSSVGAMFTNRSQSSVVAGSSNQAYGADATFSFFENLALGGYYAKTVTGGLAGEDDSYYARFDFSPDLYGFRAEYLKVGNHFNPEIGFVRRTDFRRSFATARFSPRPKSLKAVRQFTWEGSFEYFLNGAGQLESRDVIARFSTEFENSDRVT